MVYFESSDFISVGDADAREKNKTPDNIEKIPAVQNSVGEHKPQPEIESEAGEGCSNNFPEKLGQEKPEEQKEIEKDAGEGCWRICIDRDGTSTALENDARYNTSPSKAKESDEFPYFHQESTSSKSHLKKKLSTRSSEEEYRCPTCDKKFSWRTSQLRHIRLHTGEKPFSCDECGKQFRQKVNLTWHRMSHTGERPFACSICTKAFNRPSSLTTHMNTHSERGHKCHLCEYQTAYSKHLKLHMKRKHSKE